jgi:hypothetical protein
MMWQRSEQNSEIFRRDVDIRSEEMIFRRVTADRLSESEGSTRGKAFDITIIHYS